MKVGGTGSAGPAGSVGGARKGGGEGFRLPSAAGASGPARANGVTASQAVMGMEALLTLQDGGTPAERRRRAVGRAGRLLDVLERMRVALLEGELSGADLQRLQRTLREQRAATDDPRLEMLLDEIETRGAVELAKLEQAAAARAA